MDKWTWSLLLLFSQLVYCALAHQNAVLNKELPIIRKEALQTCSNWTNCPSSCEHWYEYESDILIPLIQFTEFRHNMDTAIGILNKWGRVISDDKWYLHSTLQYLCCYSPVTYVQIAEIISQIKWKPFNMTFTSTVCAYGGNGNPNYTSIITLLDDEGQQYMEAFVKQIEDAIASNGIPIHVPRSKQEPFHSTLGVVETATYPIAQALAEIAEKVPVYNTQPMTIHSFWMLEPPWEFHATTEN